MWRLLSLRSNLSLHKDRDITVIMLQIKTCLSEGVSLHDVSKFIDQPRGSDLLSKALKVNVSSSHWTVIPQGFFCVPVFVPIGEVSSNLVSDYTHSSMFLQQPLLSVPFCTAVGEQVFSAAVTYNNAFFDEHHKLPENANFKALLNALKAEVKFE